MQKQNMWRKNLSKLLNSVSNNIVEMLSWKPTPWVYNNCPSVGCALRKRLVAVEAKDVNKCKTVKTRAHCPSTRFTPASISWTTNSHLINMDLNFSIKWLGIHILTIHESAYLNSFQIVIWILKSGIISGFPHRNKINNCRVESILWMLGWDGGFNYSGCFPADDMPLCRGLS